MPDDVAFRTTPEIALHQIRTALAAGIPRGIVLMDAGYGVDTKLRTALTELGLTYAAGVEPHTSVWRPERGRCRQSPGRVAGGRRASGVAMPSTNPSM